MTTHAPENERLAVIPLSANEISEDVTIFVRDYETEGEIGLFDHEKGVKQRLRFSVEAGCQYGNLSQCQNQETIVCYKSIVALIENELSKGHVDLVETLADRLCTVILIDKRILWTTVQIEKRDAIVQADSVGIRVTRRQKRRFDV